jgi:Domain of unknown function (DUF1931)
MIMGYTRMKEFLRRSTGVDLDKSDMDCLTDLIGKKLNDLLVIAVRNASYNSRDIVMEPALPLTKGILEHIRVFRRYEEELDLKPILDHLATYPALERTLSLDREGAARSRGNAGYARRTDHENHRSQGEKPRQRCVGPSAASDGVVALRQKRMPS